MAGEDYSDRVILRQREQRGSPGYTLSERNKVLRHISLHPGISIEELEQACIFMSNPEEKVPLITADYVKSGEVVFKGNGVWPKNRETRL